MLKTVNLESWLTYARYLAGKAGVTLSIAHGNHPSTDGKVIYLPPIPRKLKQSDAIDLLWFIAHETNHIVETDFKLVHDKSWSKYPDQIIHEFANSFEDPRIDTKRSRGPKRSYAKA